MAEIWKPQSLEVYKSWLDTILDEAQDKLSEWENNFLESIQTRLERNSQLTEKQADILERIYAEKTN